MLDLCSLRTFLLYTSTSIPWVFQRITIIINNIEVTESGRNTLLLLFIELGSLNARNAVPKCRDIVGSRSASLAFLSIPDGLFLVTGLALLGSFVQDWGSRRALAFVVDEGIGASLHAGLVIGIPDGSQLAHSAGVIRFVPLGIAGDAGFIVIEVGFLLGACALRSVLVESEAVRAANALLVLFVPDVGRRACYTLSVSTSLVISLASARASSGIPGLVFITLQASVVFWEPFRVTGNARVSSILRLEVRFILGAATLGDALVEAKSRGTGNTFVVLQVPGVRLLAFLAFSS